AYARPKFDPISVLPLEGPDIELVGAITDLGVEAQVDGQSLDQPPSMGGAAINGFNLDTDSDEAGEVNGSGNGDSPELLSPMGRIMLENTVRGEISPGTVLPISDSPERTRPLGSTFRGEISPGTVLPRSEIRSSGSGIKMSGEIGIEDVNKKAFEQSIERPSPTPW
ncbi:MAG: hypothetical protein ACRD4B_10150, partial [Acidobacteriota bacterium]